MPRPALPAVERVPGGRAFACLSRRVRALIVAAVLFVVLFALALVLPVPYVILSPGPTYNTLGVDPNSKAGDAVIVLGGKTPSPTSGNLNMTTVAITADRLTAFQVVSAWLRHDQVVVPRSAIYPPGTTEQQTNEANTADFTASQDNATAAALCYLGYPKAFGVIEVVPKGPSDGVLNVGDQLVSIDGRPATTTAQVSAALTATAPGTTVPVVVKRGSAPPTTVQVKLGTAPKTPGEPTRKGGYLGVELDNTCLAPFTVTINLEDVGGPSAGLMFALGIIDKVGKVDLTKGRFIAGTGELDSAAGKVEPIGGIQLKMIAARRKGASVFLAPAGNCSDVRGNIPKGLQVVKVSTVRGAVQDLLAIQKGQPVPSC